MDELGISVRELARRLDTDKGTVVHWRKGRYLPRQGHVEALAGILRMSVGSLVAGEEPAAPPSSSAPLISTTGPCGEAKADERRVEDGAALIDRMAAIEIQPVVDTLERVTPDLMKVLAEAREYARGHRDDADGA
jgi:transcriptional regulator with XRE-family HTH domain